MSKTNSTAVRHSKGELVVLGTPVAAELVSDVRRGLPRELAFRKAAANHLPVEAQAVIHNLTDALLVSKKS